MLVQGALRTAHFVTHPAAEEVLNTVQFAVFFQLLTGGKLFATFVTCVGVLSCMHDPVSLKVARQRKASLTDVTCELPGVTRGCCVLLTVHG